MPGRLSPQVQNQGRYPYRRLYNPQQGFNRPQSQPQINPPQGQRNDRSRMTCHHCGRFGHMEKDCRRKLGLCLRCGKAGHMAKDCTGTEKARVVEITEEKDQDDEQGFVEDL